MGLSRSLTTGASALGAQQKRLDVISNNLANTNTTGFKGSRVNFAEQFNQVYQRGTSPDSTAGVGVGGTNPVQYGLGVKVAGVQQNMSQGITETKERSLDLAIKGDGFFIFNQNGNDVYSRAGAVQQDRDGSLTDSGTGAFLQGYNVATDATGKIIKNLDGSNKLDGAKGNIVIPSNSISSPKQTQSISFYGNLNSQAATGETRQTSLNVYDNLGAVHTLGFTFTKSATANEYTVASTIDGSAVTPSASTIKFNSDGTLNTPLDLTFTAAALNTATGSKGFDSTTPKDVTVSLANKDNLLNGLTQFSGTNTASFNQQDGYKTGELQSLNVDSEGKIWGAFTNGQSEVLGQVLEAKFANRDGLLRNGDNYYSASPNSGAAIVGAAGSTFSSEKIQGYALEQSNVDMTTQFTDMIAAQRAFEAASRTVTVSDTLLGEVNQLKR